MKEFSKETIEIDGKEYTLFLNRKGIVSWENITKVTKKTNELQNKYKGIIDKINDDKPVEVTDDTNPFEYADDSANDLLQDKELLRNIYIKFYWIALYENHKLPISEVEELFSKAEKEYGLEQLMGLANQMLEDANTNKYENTELKKLKALRQTK